MKDNSNSTELFDAILDEKKIRIRQTILNIHKQASRDRLFYLNIFYNKAVAAAVAAVLVIGGGIISFNHFNNSLNSKLIAENFEVDMSFLNTRGGESNYNNSILNGINYYNNRKYNLALNVFKAEPNTIIARLYSGYCLMQLGDYSKAEKEFVYIINDDNNLFIDQAEWNLGLCYLKANKLNSAKEVFENISKGDSAYKNKALKLYKDIKTN